MSIAHASSPANNRSAWSDKISAIYNQKRKIPADVANILWIVIVFTIFNTYYYIIDISIFYNSIDSHSLFNASRCVEMTASLKLFLITINIRNYITYTTYDLFVYNLFDC